MRNDAITTALASAIVEANRLNQQAGVILTKAIEKADVDAEWLEDFRFKCAARMYAGTIRQHNVAVRYFVTQEKINRKERDKKAGK